MNVEKWIRTLDSRKVVALLLVFILAVLNRILDFGMTTGEVLQMCLPLLAFVGVEGILDYARAKNGSEDSIAKAIESMFKAYTPSGPQGKKDESLDRLPFLSEAFNLSGLTTEDLNAAQVELMKELSRIEKEIKRRHFPDPEDFPEEGES